MDANKEMTNGKKLDQQIATIKGTTTRFNNQVQETAVGIIRHAEEFGDCTRALKLVLVVPHRLQAQLIKFFSAYSPIGMNVKKGLVRLNKVGADNYNPFNAAAAELNPWFVVQEKDREELPDTTLGDVNEAMLKLADRFAKRAAKGSIVANDREPVMARIKALRELAQVA